MIQIDKYRIRRFDEHNIVIEEFIEGGKPHKARGVEGISQDKWVIRGYFSRLDGVFSYLICHVAFNNDVTSLKELQERINDLLSFLEGKGMREI